MLFRFSRNLKVPTVTVLVAVTGLLIGSAGIGFLTPGPAYAGIDCNDSWCKVVCGWTTCWEECETWQATTVCFDLGHTCDMQEC